MFQIKTYILRDLPITFSSCFINFEQRKNYEQEIHQHIKTLACPSVLSAVNKNRQKFEPYADISEETFSNFNHNHNQIKTLMAK